MSVNKQRGKVVINGSELIYSGALFDNCSINLNNVRYIYFVSSKHVDRCIKYLLIFEEYQKNIPEDAEGFDEVFAALLDFFHIEEELYFSYINLEEDFKVELWRKIEPNNTSILNTRFKKGKFLRELNEGFIIEDNPSLLIPWNTTKDKLLNLDNIVKPVKGNDSKDIIFAFPVRIGNIVIENLRGYNFRGDRSDVPLQFFNSQSVIDGNGDKNYFLIYEALKKLIGNPFKGYHRSDQNNSLWKFEGLLISLTYWYDSTYSYESGYASLTITNERVYKEYLINKYLLPKDIEAVFYEKKLLIPCSFRKSKFYKYATKDIRTLLSKRKMGTVMWIDKLSNNIGIANDDFTIIIPRQEVLGMELQNIWPAKGRGSSTLTFLLGNGSRLNVLEGDCEEQDGLAKEFSSLADINVNFLPGFSNC